MKSLFLLLSFFGVLSLSAQKIDAVLEKKLKELTAGFKGDLGIYVYDLAKQRFASINADTLYPTASMIKVPILVGLMHQIEAGKLDYHQQMTYTDSLYYSEGDDMLASFKSGEKIDLAKVLMLMMSTSDNAASLWLQGLAGGGSVINQYMEALGLPYTKVNSRTEGRRKNWEQYGWGQTTPREMASLLKMIVENKIINPKISERMLRLMGRQYWDEYALSQIPPNVFVADKGGAVDASRSELLYVNGANPYIFCLATKNNADQSWENNNEAWQLTRKVSALLWKYYNPKSKWQAP